MDTPSGTTITITATYTCNTGYIVTGSSSRTCGSDGLWSPAAPTCDSKYMITAWYYSSISVYGYVHISTPFVTQLTIFLLLIILRIVVDCGPLGNPVNGQVDMSFETTFMSTATYTCNTGYNLIGPISRTCGSDGVWSPAAPTCERKCDHACLAGQ